jgi:hypothetical protein
MIVSVSALVAFEEHKIVPPYLKDGDYMGIRILDTKRLTFDKIDGIDFCEISDIAYDKANKRLIALSDRAKLFTLSIEIKDKKIHALKPLSAKRLKNIGDKKLLRPYRDSEGLALVEDGMLISFENYVRITHYNADLKALKNLPLAQDLANRNHYRGKNKGLEALTYSKVYGYITTAEFPLRHTPRGYHDIYTQEGKLCRVKMESDNAITEIEMMPDGNLLVLERKFRLRDFSFESTLLKVYLKEKKEGICRSELLAWMDTKEGWDIDNYEGLTHLYDNLYLMISDNNNNSFEKTLLTLFEIKEKR